MKPWVTGKRGHKGGSKLFRQVVSTVGLLCLAFLAFNAFLVYPGFRAILVHGVERDAETLSRHLLPELFSSVEVGGYTTLSVEELSLIERMERDFKLFKLKVYNEQGFVLYSTNPNEFGTANRDEYFHRKVMQGERIASLQPAGGVSLEGDAVDVDVVEVYVPYMKQGEFQGALELYYDVSELKREMDALAFRSLAGMGVLALGLIAVVALLLARETSYMRVLEQNQKLREDVDRILQHDLKAPLTNVLSGVSYLQSDMQKSEHRDILEQVRLSGWRMLNMINLSLDLYRMEKGIYSLSPQPLVLSDLCTQVIDEQRAKADEKKIELTLEEGEGEPVVAFAEGLLSHMMLANLLKNAIEASPPGSRVSILIGRTEHVASIAITNPGEIPAEVREHIFEKYYTSGKKDGTGLGTYSAMLIARTQKGALRVESEGGMVTFTVFLPLATLS